MQAGADGYSTCLPRSSNLSISWFFPICIPANAPGCTLKETDISNLLTYEKAWKRKRKWLDRRNKMNTIMPAKINLAIPLPLKNTRQATDVSSEAVAQCAMRWNLRRSSTQREHFTKLLKIARRNPHCVQRGAGSWHNKCQRVRRVWPVRGRVSMVCSFHSAHPVGCPKRMWLG
jgi:hypothetical protein